MVELDREVAAVRQTILGDDSEWPAEKILAFDLSSVNAIKTIENPAAATRERAFQTILKNRTFHGGIITAGSGFLKNGENGKGIASRSR